MLIEYYVTMRIALIGLSSPCGYLYDHNKQFSAGEPWGWNPILESPVGLVTLFDQLWFLHRALCPISMRNLGFVKFLNEDSEYGTIIDSIIAAGNKHDFKSGNKTNKIIIERGEGFTKLNRFCSVIHNASGMYPGPRSPIDNHSHGIKFINEEVMGNTWSIKNLYIDLTVLGILSKRAGIEFITNTFTSPFISPEFNWNSEMAVSEKIIIKRIPSVVNKLGPILDEIDRIRDNKYLTEFRDKIGGCINSQSASEDIRGLVTRIEQEYQNYKNAILLKKHKSSGILEASSRNALEIIIAVITSPVTFAKDIIDSVLDIKEASETRKMNWTAFMSNLEDNNENKSKV